MVFVENDSFVVRRPGNGTWEITDKFEGQRMILVTDEIEDLMNVCSWIIDKTEDMRNR